MTRILMAALCAVLLSACGGLADIRPDSLKGEITEAQRQKGEALFDKMIEAHGGADAWQQFERVETTFTDQWNNWLFFQFTPYADNNKRASLESYIHHFPHSRVEFLEGTGQGEVWLAVGSEVQRLKGGMLQKQSIDKDKFLTVVFQNPEAMVGVMFRLMSADQLAYAGQKTWRGQTYETVLLSWGTLEPQADLDQWLLYLDPDTGRLVATEFTVRMSGSGDVGFYHYKELKEVEGMLLPHEMGAYLSKDDDEPVHVYRFGEMRFSRYGEPEEPSAAR